MQGINPCPFCGGEVEMVKLPRGGKDAPWRYRIECRKCHALNARGEGFKGESTEAARERIRQYEKIMYSIAYPLQGPKYGQEGGD